MKLKTRIIISFFIIVLEPLLFTGLAFWAFSQYQFKTIEKQYGIENPTYQSLSNTAEILNSLTNEQVKVIQEVAKEDPERFENIQYLTELNKELQGMHSYLLVCEGDNITYYGCEDYPAELVKKLARVPEFTTGTSDGMYLGGKVQALVKRIDFHTEKVEDGSVFIISNAVETLPQTEELFRNMLVTVIIILTVTALGLTWWIYRGVISPLDKLRTATRKIKEGNLDFSVSTEGVSEIAELCQDFEDMRQRLKENAEEKIEFDRESKELISNISHDLKTPITAVKGYVEGIMDGVANTPEKMERYIKTVYNKANEMDRLINELTFYSKMDTNKIPYTFNKISVTEFFDDCAEDLQMELSSKNVEFSYSNYVEPEVLVIADAEQIKRVVNNIVSNSLKYTDASKQRRINLRVKDVGDFIQVEIEDNGKGIAAKDLPNIFDRFYRTDSSRNSSKGGSGIGLSIVKKIMEDHGGKVWATSKENIGTVMYFVLRKYQEVPVNE
ncbi:MAG TPA: HAMP domain-containing protein [Candidatus Blautia stercoravium]|nr:HAMP domain-containing protein [Candidatus Blautia stercoravium]